MESPLRVLVVDDSVVYRKVVRDLLAEAPEIEVVGVAADGKVALDLIDKLRPDLLMLDVEMPQIDGLGVLRELRRHNSTIGAIMLSALTSTGARLTTSALELGAFDFVLKPSSNRAKDSVAQLRRDLLPRIAAFAANRRHASVGQAAAAANRQTTVEQRPPSHAAVEVITIGGATGGPAALAELLPCLPASLPVPVLIVQHLPPMFTDTLATALDRNCALTVCEARDHEPLAAGRVYLAPGGKQMQVAGRFTGWTTSSLLAPRPGQDVIPPHIRITDDPAENNCRPAVDCLFRSAADVYGAHVLGIILTGMGDDGTAGCRQLKQHGARVVTQSEDSCAVYGMPRAVVEAGFSDASCPLDELASAIQRILPQRQPLCN